MQKRKIPSEKLHVLMISYAIAALLLIVGIISIFFVDETITYGRITVYTVIVTGFVIGILTECKSRKLQKTYQTKR
jgi:EamA domain-containing membrane protein RarD